MTDVLEKHYGRVVAVARKTYGSILTAPASIADTVLAVATTDDFDDAGGQVVIGDELYDYVAIDEVVSTITLASGLLVAADLDDFVELYDPEVDGIVVEYIADVLLDDQDPGDEPIEVTVQHGLVNMLAESIRGRAAEAVVLIRDGEDDFVIWQIDGKLAVDVALEAAVEDIGVSVQEAFDRADVAAAAAADAASNATTALTAANGKNKVTVSLSSPGATANTAGDIWFRKESSTQTVIEQWQGLGGTSWQQVTLNNQVIANLDAGKLVAGSAFTNALWVKTNLTLGDASTNGVIQSHDFAGSSVGIYIDKLGMVAKGGSMTGTTLNAVTTTSGTFQTAASGKRIVIGSGVITAYPSSGAAATIDMSAGGIINIAASNVSMSGTLGVPNVNATGVHVTGTADAGTVQTNNISGNGFGINFSNGIVVTGGVDASVSVVAPTVTGTTSVHGQNVFVDAIPVVAGGEAVFMTNTGRLVVHTAPSLLAYKRDVSVVEVDTDALAQVRPITWRYREDAPFEISDPDETFWGIPADPLLDSPGLAFLTDTDAEGTVSVKEQRLPLALLAAFGEQHARIVDLERQRAEDRRLIERLAARLEALEA